MAENAYDILIGGAGFAGAAAASILCEAGLRVAVLEARDRVGGRAFTRPFRQSDKMLEFGGSWIAPWHHRIRYYAGLHECALKPTLPVQDRRWHSGSELLLEEPAGPGEREIYDAGLSRIKADVRSFATGHVKDTFGLSLTDVTLNGYLHRIDASEPLRAQVMAWWCISGNGDPNRISAAEFLSSCAYGEGSPEGMMQSLGHTIIPGAEDLVRRMLSASGADVKLGTAVEDVRQFSSGVQVGCSNGEQFRAKGLVLCLPLNVLRNIRFAPAVERKKTRAMTLGHGGRSFKIWIEARGIKPGVLATGGLSGLQWAFAEREAAGRAVYVTGFGLQDGQFDPASPQDVENGLRRFFPESEVVASDWHDWVSDPWSRGTWVALPADALWIGNFEEWQNEGCVFFASADFAPSAPGWFESAIVSGEAAAYQMLQMFADA